MFTPSMVDERANRHLWNCSFEWEDKVGQSRLPDTWISLQDFYSSASSRKPAFRAETSAPRPDRTAPSGDWIDASDYFIDGVRVADRAPELDQFFVTLKETTPKAPPPPEAGLTVYDALKQIHSVYGPQNAIFSRLSRLEQQDRQELDSGHINIEEFERRAVATAIIRENHGRRMEKITQWYLDNYFRIFENPEPTMATDEKSH